MKLYSLYEFPPTKDKLDEILHLFYQLQPLSYVESFDGVRSIIAKRPSRAQITLKNLIKLGLLEGKSEISLTWESQIYLDMGKNLEDLLLYLIYKRAELFFLCERICDIDEEFLLSNPKLLVQLWDIGYETERLTTAKEKLYAIKRLILCCKIQNGNPFRGYRQYIDFLKKIESVYLLETNNQFNVPISIMDLKKKLLKCDVDTAEFNKGFIKLYFDPIFATYTSYTSVISEFADQEYFCIDKESYYYFKLLKRFFEKD